MKKTVITTLALAVGLTGANAAVLSFKLEADNPNTSGQTAVTIHDDTNGDLSSNAQNLSTAGTSATWTITAVDQTIDGHTGLTITFDYTATAGGVATGIGAQGFGAAGIVATGGLAGGQTNDVSRINNGQTITHSISNIQLVTAVSGFDFSASSAFGATEYFDSEVGTWNFDQSTGIASISTGTDDQVRQTGISVDLTANLTAVPEPSSTALLGLGGLALIMRRRK